MMDENQQKISFEGTIQSVQPRATVWRYKMDNRTHREVGYNLFLSGEVDGLEASEFSVAVSEKQFLKYRFHIGDRIKGTAWTKMYPELEYADYYRAGGLRKLSAAEVPASDRRKKGPWIGEAPELQVYTDRGCRVLNGRTWAGKCFRCKWACMSNVTIEWYWGRIQKHRFESFCYGPTYCSLYKRGRARAVPYKGQPPFMDEGFMDDLCLENRMYLGLDDEEDGGTE